MTKKLTFLVIGLLVSLMTTQAQMTLVFDTNLSDGTTITLPLNGTVNVTVDWGDGNSTTFTTPGNKDHTYLFNSTRTVKISGSLSQFGAQSYPNADKLVRITDFGNLGITSLNYAFYDAVNLIEVPTSIPSTVTQMSCMFYGADAFNQNIGSWDVSSVTSMDSMFFQAGAFNQNIGSWNVSNVTSMSHMFCTANYFNQDINSWNVSNVTDMSYMFKTATAFDQDISSWDVSSVTDMSSMFLYAGAFNQDISNWNVSNVTDMSSMLSHTLYFNQDISSWDVSSVTDMSGMFAHTGAFNQDISSWDVSSVTNMYGMFASADAFNQNLGSWDVSSVTTMMSMFSMMSLSTSIYDATLIGWAEQTLQPGVTFSGGNSKYSCIGEPARAILDNAPNNWAITDGGLQADNTDPEITSIPNSQYIDANTNCEAILPDYTADVTATDNCDSDLTITQNPVAGFTISGTTVVTLTVTDDNGNSDNANFTIFIVDTIAPIITSTHYNQNLGDGIVCEVILPDYTGDLTATDNCDNNLTVTQSPAAGILVSGQTNEITLTATDVSDNFTEITFNVAVSDNIDPEIVCVNNATRNADNTHHYTVSGTEFDPVLTDDNCEIASVINNYNQTLTLAGEQLPEGETSIFWIITDEAGNPVTCSFYVQVNAYVGVDTLQQNGISIYPNPTNGIVNFKFADNNIQQIKISDLTGKTIIEKVNIQQNGTIDLSSFERGIYIIKIQTDKEILTTKIVKE